MSRRRFSVVVVVPALLAVAGVVAWPLRTQLRANTPDIPVTQVRSGNLELRVQAMGELRAIRTSMLVAPPVAGGTLQIIHLAKTGTPVRAGDAVIEFDPSEQEYNLEQNRSELLQAEQEITKAKADAEVQDAQDKVALLKAKFDVRRAELDVSKNELVSAIDAKKNLLALEQARRALAQLEQDVKSHAASNQAAIAVDEEKRNKARLAMEQAQHNIESMRVRSPIDGLVVVKQNRDAAGGFFFSGMVLPEFREGDQVNPGAFVAQVIDTAQMELAAHVSESDRANLKAGLPVEADVDSLPGDAFRGKITSVAGVASSSMWEADPNRKFEVVIQLDKADPRLRPGLTSQLIITAGQVKDVRYLPRQAIFERDGKPVVYVRSGGHFEAREVKITYQTESRAAVEGLQDGAEVALVNPQAQPNKPGKPAAPAGPAIGGGGM